MLIINSQDSVLATNIPILFFHCRRDLASLNGEMAISCMRLLIWLLERYKEKIWVDSNVKLCSMKIYVVWVSEELAINMNLSFPNWFINKDLAGFPTTFIFCVTLSFNIFLSTFSTTRKHFLFSFSFYFPLDFDYFNLTSLFRECIKKSKW